MNIEPLEPRIAPASLTFTDVDGDKVVITTTGTGTLSSAPGGNVTIVGGQLTKLEIDDPAFQGAKVSIMAKRDPVNGGDGRVNVGVIDATGVDLGAVVVDGDLAFIVAGSGTDPNLGLTSLKAASLGRMGMTSGASILAVLVNGKLGALNVGGDVIDTFVRVISLGSAAIGGSLIGGTLNESGVIQSVGDMGKVKIARDVVGGAGENSGEIHSEGTLGTVTVGGNVRGGAGNESGRIVGDTTTTAVKIGGSLIGGGGVASGQVDLSGAAKQIRIGGDLIGGPVASSGFIGSRALDVLSIGGSVIGGGSFAGTALVGAVGRISIGGDLIGGSVFGSDSAQATGMISANGKIGSVTIGGSLIAGTDASTTGSLSKSGLIVSVDDIGPVKIGGSILGNSTNPARIIAKGQDVKPATGFDIAIASLTVGGDVRFANILAGFSSESNPINGDAAIGAVNVKGHWVASNLVAGARDSGMDGFGVNDSVHTTGDTALIARIASITIRGDVSGSRAAGDNFGFVAEQIDKLRIGTRTFTLAPGAGSLGDNFLIPLTDDFHLLEVN